MSTQRIVAGEIAAYMLGKPGTTASPREVRIAPSMFPAAWFEQLRELPEGSPARREAAANGHSPTYVHAGLYVQGPLPDTWHRAKAASRTLIYVERDGQRWMVSGWADAFAVRNKPEFHPFGQWFLLQHVTDGLDLGRTWQDDVDVIEL